MLNSLGVIKEKALNTKRPVKILLMFLILDFFVFAVSFSLHNVFRPDILAIAVYFSFYAYLFLTKRKEDILYLLISSLLSIVWILFANSHYGYNQRMLSIFGYSSFPLFAWASGLAILYVIYLDIEKLIIKSKSIYQKIIIFTALYLFFIVSLETISYHFFDIKNSATSMYPGLPLCDCIHAPVWMQIVYLTIGPMYFLICVFFTKLFYKQVKT